MAMKYKIELSVRGRGVQLLALDKDEKNELIEESLDDVYLEWIDKKNDDFYLERQFLMRECDRFSLTIKDEDDNIVYESEDVNEVTDLDRTVDDEGDYIESYEFKGVKDGIYLTRIQTIKGCYYDGEFELDEPFDKDRLYLIRDKEISDELMGDDVFPLDTIYYQRGESIKLDADIIYLEHREDQGEQYYETFLLRVEEGDWWHNLKS
jgi:hypothetical protein